MKDNQAFKFPGSYPLTLDHNPAQTWREAVMGNIRLLGVAMASRDTGTAGPEFVWRQGKDLVVVSRSGNSWQVAYLTQGRLLGPRTVVYQGLHRQAKFAAWDVMARVISASHDEEEGMSAAVNAAHWMRRQEASGRSPSDA